MADEITLSVTTDITKDNLKLFFRPGTITPDLSSSVHDNISKSCTSTTTAAVSTALGAASNGYAFFRNLNTTTTLTSDTVIFGNGSTPAFMLRCGEVAVMRVAFAPTSMTVKTGASGETVTYQAMFLSP
jgi:hypothetical protein